MTGTSIDWQEANKRYLTAALAVVREHLVRRAASRNGQDPDKVEHASHAAEERSAPAAEALPSPSALETVCGMFGLSPFERDLLLLCAGVELDGRFAAHCAAAQGDASQLYPTFSLALAALPDAHWSAVRPNAPLRRWRLIEVRPGDSLVGSQLRIDESVLHYLVGLPYVDERLEGFIETPGRGEELAPSHQAIAREIGALWSDRGLHTGMPVIQLSGGDRASKRSIVAEACAGLGLRMQCISADKMPVSATECEQLARLWERTAALDRSVLLIDAEEMERGKTALLWFAESVQSPTVISVRERLANLLRRYVSIDVERMGSGEQLALWHSSLGQLAGKLNGELETIVSQFSLNSRAIREISEDVARQASEKGESVAQCLIADACRLQSRSHVDDLAMRIEPRACWGDLVLPVAQEQTLRVIAASVRQRFRVQETWGFARKSSRGLAITALFSGPSGTGKTMAAEVLANDMQLDLMRIDLSRVVSKYIGETEKNLRRVFDAAEKGGAILFFDEADALFGKRSEVKDSHDRYANIEISYLLQRMEEYSGLAILATNMKESMDAAFLRRIRFVVHFPFPDAAQRAEIWRRIFPSQTPTESLSIDKLAGLSIAGGNIHNVAVYAAFLAADAGEPVRMAHIARAAQAEYTKLGRSLAASDIGGWI